MSGPIDYTALLMRRRRQLARLSDAQWRDIVDLLPARLNVRATNSAKAAPRLGRDGMRSFVEAVLWVADTHLPWKRLPAHYGKPHSVYMRFMRWHELGVWPSVLRVLSDQPDLQFNLAELLHRYGTPAGDEPK